MSFQQYFSRGIRYLIISHKQTATCDLVLKVRVGDKDRIMSYQPAITVDTTEVGKIKDILCLSGRIRRIITIVRPYGNHIILSPFQGIGYIYDHRQVATKMFFYQPAIHKHLALPHDGFKMQE